MVEKKKPVEVVEKPARFNADVANKESILDTLRKSCYLAILPDPTDRYKCHKELRAMLTYPVPTPNQTKIKEILDSVKELVKKLETHMINKNIHFDEDIGQYMITVERKTAIYINPQFTNDLEKLNDILDEVEILIRFEMRKQGIIDVKDKGLGDALGGV